MRWLIAPREWLTPNAVHRVVPDVHGGCRMSDEKPVPETFDTIAAKIDALGRSIDARFAQVDKGFEQVDKRFAQVEKRFEQVDKRFEQVDKRFAQVDKRLDETRTQLLIEIEAVNVNVTRVYDAIITQQAKNEANDKAHEGFVKRLEDHDVRLLVLEKPRLPPS